MTDGLVSVKIDENKVEVIAEKLLNQMLHKVIKKAVKRLDACTLSVLSEQANRSLFELRINTMSSYDVENHIAKAVCKAMARIEQTEESIEARVKNSEACFVELFNAQLIESRQILERLKEREKQ